MAINDASTMTMFPSFSSLQSYSISSFPIAITLILCVALMILFGRYGRKDEECTTGTEPPEVKSRIPLFGHLIGMLKGQVGYFQTLSFKYPLYPVFTLKIFAARVYVVCEPSLIQAAYRNTKAFDFTTFVVDSSKRAFNIGENGMKIIRGETSPDYDPKGLPLNGNNGRSYLNENHGLMVEYLGPGESLLELNKGVLGAVAEFLNELGQNPGKLSLYKWMRDTLTLATSASLYGPHDPVSANHRLIDSLWDFEENMTMLMLEFLPTFICPEAYHGRAAVKTAFASYYASSHHTIASNLIKSRLDCSQKWGLTAEEIANIEISTLFLATTNSAPTSFWLLVNILSDPSLVSSIRTEVSNIISKQTADNGIEECVMDITLFQSSCPILMSCFRETLRFVDAATSVRSVTKDVLLTSSTSQSSFLLKAGNVIQLPSGVTHNSPSIWGPNVDSFDPYRFLPSTIAKLSKEQKKQQAQGYFPFGGGKHLCPGRHFATTEILSLVSAIIMGCEVEGASVPERAFQKLGTAVRKPKNDVEVSIKRREGWENVKWRFDVQGKVDFEALVGEKNDG
ncbi:658df175-1cd2-41ff-bbae-f4818510a6a1 [Sclerotinia trifoliorum]|uniref:658df175-1cd2-41ff-bbae-f4818510a6a1 n=1 Tax=Sclerotinia trifoliorum TaxID=28548 RepID=A0A8H2W0Y6_9HELO|nr:658df175-1cd2-41ff-bbae-f4818510a6a1 [Sclerotinia trifoliorum]